MKEPANIPPERREVRKANLPFESPASLARVWLPRYLGQKPKKRKAQFAVFCSLRAGEGVGVVKMPIFLERTRDFARAIKMYLYYGIETGFGKGNFSGSMKIWDLAGPLVWAGSMAYHGLGLRLALARRHASAKRKQRCRPAGD